MLRKAIARGQSCLGQVESFWKKSELKKTKTKNLKPTRKEKKKAPISLWKALSPALKVPYHP